MADEIDIKIKGPLFADRDYGDIDILAFDHTRMIIYSIECKNITGAKTIYEMWNEIETYLGGRSLRCHCKRIWDNNYHCI